MGYFYPPPPQFVGGSQPYAPRLGLVQSGPVPQAPPLRGAIALATFGVILSSWTPPYFVAQGAGDIAPVIQTTGVASQPPIPSRINLNTILRAWDAPLFIAQGAGDIAPTIPAGAAPSQPPGINRASQSIAIGSWQIDATVVIYQPALGSQAIASVQPPVSGVALQTIVQSWAQPYFLVQGAGDIAPSLPIISQPQPVSRTVLNGIRATWDAPWSAAYMQGAGDIAPTIPVVVSAAILPLGSVNFETILHAWQTPYFLAQGAGDIAPDLPIVSQPQARTWAQFNAIRATWELPWSAAYLQGAGDIAPQIVAPTAPSQPPGINRASQSIAINAWQLESVTVISQASIGSQTIADQPPATTYGLLYELISANQPPPYAIPKAATVASWLPPASVPSQPPVLTNVNLLTAVRAWDIPPLWPIQGQSDIAPLVPPPVAPSAPPPISSAGLYLLVRSWDAPVWWPLPANEPIAQTTIVNRPPVSNPAQMYALVAASQPPFVLPPTGEDFAPLIAAPIPVGSPPPSLANLRLLVQSWDVIPQLPQARAVVTASGPIPQQPPPLSRVNLQTIIQLNQPPWNYGQGFGFIAPYPVYTPQIGGPRYMIRRLRARRWTVSAVTYLQFEPKAPDEAVKLTFDFSPDLPTGVVLTGMPTVTISMSVGTDPSPAAIANGTAGPDITNKQIIVPAVAGLAGCDYQVHVRSLTTDPQIILSLTGILPVRA